MLWLLLSFWALCQSCLHNPLSGWSLVAFKFWGDEDKSICSSFNGKCIPWEAASPAQFLMVFCFVVSFWLPGGKYFAMNQHHRYEVRDLEHRCSTVLLCLLSFLRLPSLASAHEGHAHPGIYSFRQQHISHFGLTLSAVQSCEPVTQHHSKD